MKFKIDYKEYEIKIDRPCFKNVSCPKDKNGYFIQCSKCPFHIENIMKNYKIVD